MIGVELCKTRMEIFTNPLQKREESKSLIGDISKTLDKKAQDEGLDNGSDMKTAMFYAINNKIPLVLLEKRADKRLYTNEYCLEIGDYQPIVADWSKSLVICTQKQLKKCTPNTLRSQVYFNKEGVSTSPPLSPTWIVVDGERLEDCGWHFTWMGGRQLRKYKADTNTFDYENGSFAFDTLSSDSISDILNIKINNNLFLKPYPLASLPQEIFELPRVKNFLLPDEDINS